MSATVLLRPPRTVAGTVAEMAEIRRLLGPLATVPYEKGTVAGELSRFFGRTVARTVAPNCRTNCRTSRVHSGASTT